MLSVSDSPPATRSDTGVFFRSGESLEASKVVQPFFFPVLSGIPHLRCCMQEGPSSFWDRGLLNFLLHTRIILLVFACELEFFLFLLIVRKLFLACLLHRREEYSSETSRTIAQTLTLQIILHNTDFLLFVPNHFLLRRRRVHNNENLLHLPRESPCTTDTWI